MSKAFLSSDLESAVTLQAKEDLEKFILFSELRTGAPQAAEERLLQSLARCLAHQHAPQ